MDFVEEDREREQGPEYVSTKGFLYTTRLICIAGKLRTALGKFGEFWAHIAHFWLEWVGRNQFVYTQFSKHRKEIADPNSRLAQHSE